MLRFLLELLGLLKPKHKKKKRKLTRKEIIRRRNLKIAIIMRHMRKHKETAGKTITSERLFERAKRIRQKKEEARKWAEKTWQQRVRPAGEQRSVNIGARVQEMRVRVRTSRTRARDLWG